MRTLLVGIAIIAITCSAAEAKRKHVRIYKPSPPAVDASRNVPLVAVPPIAVAFDLVRRTSCDPRIAVSTGKGDPGFDLVNGPRVGNFLIPAIWERCASRPQPK